MNMVDVGFILATSLAIQCLIRPTNPEFARLAAYLKDGGEEGRLCYFFDSHSCGKAEFNIKNLKSLVQKII